jgi:hypothetical protein
MSSDSDRHQNGIIPFGTRPLQWRLAVIQSACWHVSLVIVFSFFFHIFIQHSLRTEGYRSIGTDSKLTQSATVSVHFQTTIDHKQ